MIDGNVHEFLDLLSRGFEVIFVYDNKKYCAQGWLEEGIYELNVAQWEPWVDHYIWIKRSAEGYDMNAFKNDKIFDGKSFWEIQEDIQWVDE